MQVLIYIGAVVILFLFGIMLTRAPMRDEPGSLDNYQRWAPASCRSSSSACSPRCSSTRTAARRSSFDDDARRAGSTDNVGTVIFRDYLVPFEVVSLLLLAALIGAVVLARRD